MASQQQLFDVIKERALTTGTGPMTVSRKEAAVIAEICAQSFFMVEDDTKDQIFTITKADLFNNIVSPTGNPPLLCGRELRYDPNA